MEIRTAREEDLPEITAIYNEAVVSTTATFDLEPKTVAERLPWFKAHDLRFALLVADSEGRISGWISLSRWSERKAYDGTTELSVYVAEAERGRGIGRALMGAAIEAARKSGFHTIVSRISEGNEVSFFLHDRFGFRKVGIMREVGEKFGRYLDVHLLQLMLEDSRK